MSRRTSKRRIRQIVNCDLELRPLMNVFIVLIPMLLMSAVFLEIRVIEMTLPHAAAAEQAPPSPPFELAIRIRPDAYVVEATGLEPQAIPRHATTGAPVAGATPSSSDGTADTFSMLSRALTAIAAAHPGTREVRIVAEATTRYHEIVAVMDVARAAGLPQAALEGAALSGI